MPQQVQPNGDSYSVRLSIFSEGDMGIFIPDENVGPAGRDNAYAVVREARKQNEQMVAQDEAKRAQEV